MRSSPTKRLFAAAVEKVGDVRIFLGLGHAQLRAAGVGDDLAQDVRERLRREDRLHQLVELVAVLRHADRRGETHDARAREAGKRRIEHGAEDFAHPVGAEIEAQHAVAVLHAAIVADHRRHDELVVVLVRIGVGDGRLRVGKARAFGRDHRVIGLGHALPALVAIHGVVAADHGGDRHRGGSAALSVLRSSAADCGGVSRPSVNAWTTAGTPASVENFGERRRRGPGANARRPAKRGRSDGRCRRCA